jgi:hypothetical protein
MLGEMQSPWPMAAPPAAPVEAVADVAVRLGVSWHVALSRLQRHEVPGRALTRGPGGRGWQVLVADGAGGTR